MKISIIIPTWNDEKQIVGTLKRLRGISSRNGVEVIVVDGGSRDGTVEAARLYAQRVIPLGGVNRGAQLHRGARASGGELLFFLHPDAQPPGTWQNRLTEFWRSDEAKSASATVFSVDYGKRLGYRLAAVGQNLRAGWRQAARGNAGLCTTREIYEKSGGFPEIPLMEDEVFSRRLRSFGRLVRLPERIRPAARHLHMSGTLRYLLRHHAMRLRFRLGESADSLWTRYAADKVREAPGLTDGETALKRALRGRRS